MGCCTEAEGGGAAAGSNHGTVDPAIVPFAFVEGMTSRGIGCSFGSAFESRVLRRSLHFSGGSLTLSVWSGSWTRSEVWPGA